MLGKPIPLSGILRKGIMLQYHVLFCLFFCLFWSCNEVKANNKFLEMPGQGGIALFDHSELLEDSTGELSFEQVLAGNHTFLRVANDPVTAKELTQGFSRSAFWLKVSMINHTNETEWFLSSWGGLNNRVEVYLRSGQEDEFSSLQVVAGHRGATFSFLSGPNMQHTLYIRIQNYQVPPNFELEMSSVKSILHQAVTVAPVYILVFGGLLALAIYNLFYFLYLRDAGFLGLAVFIASFVMELGNYIGLGSYFSVTRDYLHYLGTSFGFIAIASLLFVFCNLLELKQNTPKSYLFLCAAFWLCLILAVLAPFIVYGVAVLGGIGLVLMPAAIAVMVILYRNQYKFLKSFLLSILFFLASALPLLLMGIGFMQTSGTLVDFTPLALLISLILLSLTQAEKVRNQSKKAERTLAENQAKDEFLTTMSHELRTPMHAVVGAGNLLKMTPLSREQQELISRLNHSSSHMLLLINDILDLARVENQLVSLEKEPFKLNEVLDSLNKLLCGEANKKGLSLDLHNHFTPFQQQLVGDAVRLKQILLNILSNGIKFTEHGQVSLVITPVDVGLDSVQLNFEIADTGIGISPDKMKDVFQPFTQAENSTSRHYGGSGLGLAISDKLVKLMGGELKLKSVVNEGSCFSFNLNLPLRAVSNEVKSLEKTIKPEQFDKERLKGYQVLLVDDDEMNRFFGERLLAACGVDGFVAESGEQALELIADQAFDLILLDISMPGMNGYQTARAIRNQKELTCLFIVALTAHAIEGERERCLDAGMDDFLAKPFELSDLQDLLLKYSNKSLIAQQVSN